MTDTPRPVVAAFDLDGTLLEGGSVFKWLRRIGGSARTWRVALWRTFPLAWGAVRSGDAADRAKESLFYGVLRGLELSDVVERSHAFAAEHLDKHGRVVYLDRLKWHLAMGHHVVIVSASPELYVNDIATLVGANGAVGTRLAVDPLGRLTGGYLGQNCRGEEKLRRLDDWISQHSIGEDFELFAYGNSRGDRRMLAAADHAFDAGKLGKLGALRRYERLSTPSPTE